MRSRQVGRPAEPTEYSTFITHAVFARADNVLPTYNYS